MIGRSAFRHALFFVAAVVVSALGCHDQSLGDVRARDGDATDNATNGGAPTCAALVGTCSPASACAVGQGHLAALATSDCSTNASTCCLPESACPTETFMCCGSGNSGIVVKTRALCESATSSTSAMLGCAAGLNPC